MRTLPILTLFALSVACRPSSVAPPSAKVSSTCPAGGGMSMVRLPLGYCIDTTEVTRAAYAAWLATAPAVSDQISACSWNASFIPPRGWDVPESDPNLPVTWVDWCDAVAYCRAVGKRLCGMPAPGGDAHGYARDSELYAACSANDTSQYAYGNTYDAAACNTADAGNGKPVAVATRRGCQSAAPGYAGVYDLSGNVWEWEDRCHDSGQPGGPNTYCSLKGGSFALIGTYSRCAYPQSSARNNPSEDIGFRCCAL